MALINCPECGKKFSKTTNACPNCENSIEQKDLGANRKKKIFLIPLGICFIMCAVISCTTKKPNNTISEQPKQLTLEEYKLVSDRFVASLPTNYTVLTTKIDDVIQKIYFTDFDFEDGMGDFFIDVYNLASKDTTTLLRWKGYSYTDEADNHGWYMATPNGEQRITGGNGGGITDFRNLNNKLLIVGGLDRYGEGDIFSISYDTIVR